MEWDEVKRMRDLIESWTPPEDIRVAVVVTSNRSSEYVRVLMNLKSETMDFALSETESREGICVCLDRTATQLRQQVCLIDTLESNSLERLGMK